MILIFEKKDNCYFVSYKEHGYKTSSSKIEDVIKYELLNFEQISFLLKNEKCYIQIEDDTLEEIERKTFFTEKDIEVFKYYKNSDFAEKRSGSYPHIERLLVGLVEKFVESNKMDIVYEKKRMYNLKYGESYYIFFRKNGISNNLEFEGRAYESYKHEILYIIKMTRLNKNEFSFCEVSKEEFEKNI